MCYKINVKNLKLDKIKKIGLNYYKIIINNLNIGYSYNYANLIKKILLNSKGYGITCFKIKNIYNDFNLYDSIYGVKENVFEILSNIKNINFIVKNNKVKEEKLIVNIYNKKTIKAKDIIKNDNLKLINPNYIIAHCLKKNIGLCFFLKIERNFGYKFLNEDYNNIRRVNKNIIISVNFCPILKIIYKIEKFYNFDNINYYNIKNFCNKIFYEKIIFFIKTNGTINIKNIIKNSINKFFKNLLNLKNLKYKKKFFNFLINKNLFISLYNINFSFKTIILFQKNNLKYIGDLIIYIFNNNINNNKNIFKEIKDIFIIYNLNLSLYNNNKFLLKWNFILNKYLNNIK